ncbi:MAG: ferrochelatase [Pseudomonadota bacterium]|nr:ferrochelatase [Pseudomonadota bacterium]
MTGSHNGRDPHLGIVLTNLGTPDEPTPPAVRRYLAEFLSDPRVIEAPRLLWWPLLHGVILRTRPRKSALAYASVWDDGSPLLSISERQAAALRERLEAIAPEKTTIALGMRYGQPSLETALAQVQAAGANRIVVLPLYPQYSATTTASTFDAVSDVLRRWRSLPTLHFVAGYADFAPYIEALANSIRDHWSARGRGDHLLLSFHGIPQQYANAGDPYPEQCATTARLLADRLGLKDSEWTLSFQSRFGPTKWLKPYTDETVRHLAGSGLRQLDVVCPGFAADCLETLEEIAEQNADFFREAGGEDLRYIPALNDRSDHIAALTELIAPYLLQAPDGKTQGT